MVHRRALLFASLLFCCVPGHFFAQTPIIGTHPQSVNTLRNGNGAPANSLGNDGDFYIDVANLLFYGPRAGGVWPASGIAIGGGTNPGGGGTSCLNAYLGTPTGAINGANANFVTSANYAAIILWVNGVGQNPGVDYNLVGGAITFLTGSIPQTGDTIIAFGLCGGTSGGGGSSGLPPGTIGQFPRYDEAGTAVVPHLLVAGDIPQIGSSQVLYNQGSAGAIGMAQTTYNQARISLNEFFPDPSGLTDSRVAVQFAQDASVALGKCIFVPSGHYTLSAPVLWDPGVCFKGENGNNLSAIAHGKASVFYPATSAFRPRNPLQNDQYAVFEDLGFNGGTYPLEIGQTASTIVHKVSCVDFTGACISHINGEDHDWDDLTCWHQTVSSRECLSFGDPSQSTLAATYAYATPASITNVAVSGNVATVTASNGFGGQGQSVTITALSNATCVPNITIAASTTTASTFTFPLVHADCSTAESAGTATPNPVVDGIWDRANLDHLRDLGTSSTITDQYTIWSQNGSTGQTGTAWSGTEGHNWIAHQAGMTKTFKFYSLWLSNLTGLGTDTVGTVGTPATSLFEVEGQTVHSSINGFFPTFSANSTYINGAYFKGGFFGSTISNCTTGGDNSTFYGLRFGQSQGLSGSIISCRGSLYFDTANVLWRNRLAIVGSNLSPVNTSAGVEIPESNNLGFNFSSMADQNGALAADGHITATRSTGSGGSETYMDVSGVAPALFTHGLYAPGTIGDCLNIGSGNVIADAGAVCGSGGGMVYPGAGIPLSTGSAWGTSFGTSGSGSACLTTNCVMVTPNLGTPSALVLTHATALPPAGVTAAQGNGAKFQLSTGSTTTNNCVKWDANGNVVDAGVTCGGGGLPPQTVNSVLLSNGAAASFGNLPTGATGALDCATVPGVCDINQTVMATKTGANTLTGLNKFNFLQTIPTSVDPGCTVTGNIGLTWMDNTSAVTTHFKLCAAVGSTPSWVTVF